MYIRELHVENVKLLRNVDVSFERGNDIRRWTVFVGENGLCKTTLLQAIALMASGPDRANQLADVPSLRDQRQVDAPMAIGAIFALGNVHRAERTYPGALRHEIASAIFAGLELAPDAQVFTGTSNYVEGFRRIRGKRVDGAPEIDAANAIRTIRELTGMSIDDLSRESKVDRAVLEGFEQGVFQPQHLTEAGHVALMLMKKLGDSGPTSNLVDRALETLGALEESAELYPKVREVLLSSIAAGLTGTILDQDPLREARARALHWWFAAGYGTQRALLAASPPDQTKDFVLGRMQSLFSDKRPLGTAFVDLFPPAVAKAYVETLRQILVGKDRLIPHLAGIDLPEPSEVLRLRESAAVSRFELNFGGRGVKIAGPWLSQGYQATISWIADLVGQMFVEHYTSNPNATRPITPEEMEGLVLIDELDLHLHPTWQAQFITALKNTFPNIQFIATTHSPMLLPGLEQDEVKLLKLDDEGNVLVTDATQSPKLMTGTGIYEAFFNIDKLYPNPLGEDLRQYSYLATDPRRSPADEERLQAIIKRLDAAGVNPGFPPEPRTAQ